DKKATDKKEDKKNADAEPKLKSDKPKVKLAFGKKEKQKDGDEVVYVRREVGSEVTRVAVPATLLDKVTQPKLAYYEKTLPSFEKQEDVTRLLVLRDGITYEIEREKKDDKSPVTWKFKQPKELAGRTAEANAVNHILTELHFLMPQKLI